MLAKAWWLWTVSLLCVWVVTAVGATAGEEPSKDSLDRDYRDELPRIAPLEPAEALESFQVKDGFRLEQVACEPVVVDPIALAFDEDGRLFVIEMRGYSEDDQEHLGRVRLLEDSQGDGRFDKSTVYAEGLSWPTAIFCYDGGVFVGAAPDILYLKDTTGDGRADLRRVEFTGFGRSNVQGLLNTFHWGLDNRIHGATSGTGASVRRGGQRDSDEPQEPLVLRGRDFALEPRTLQIEPTSGGGQHGWSFDRWGTKFVCSNSDHIQVVMFEDRYVARNPYLAAPGARVSIAVDGPQADVYRTSPVEPWRIVRTRLRRQGIVPGPLERGGEAAGYFSGATGLTIYQGHAWPRQFHGWAVVGDVGSNLVHRKRLEPDGLSYLAHRVDDQSELVTSSDIWFRPVQFANAPDGTLYLADMYREVIEHPKSLPPMIKQHLDLTSGRDRGRIYRLVPEGFQQPRPVRLGRASTAELVATLGHENGWHRETAARLLYQRQDRGGVPLLENLARQGELPEGRIRALYGLDGLDSLSEPVLLAALADPHARVRQHAVRLSERTAPQSPAVRQKLFALTDDDDLHVRYQLAFSLGEVDGPQRHRALAELARRNADDRYVRLAVLSSLAEGAGAVLAELAADPAFCRTDGGRELLVQLAQQIGKQQRSDDIAAVLRVLGTLPAGQKQVLQTLVQGLAAKPGSPLEQQIAAATGGQAGKVMQQLLGQAAEQANDPQQKVAQRAEAVHLLQLGSYADYRDLLATLLEPHQPAEVQAAALDTLAGFDDPEVARLVIRQWASFSPRLRGRAGDLLFSRSPWLAALLAAVGQQQIAVGDLEPGRWQALAAHRDPAIRQQAQSLSGSLKLARRGEVVQAYGDVLQMEGDAARGKEAFRRACAACHQLEGTGHPIGPNLAAMRNRGPEAILVNVLDPNREVNPQYLNYALITQDGRSLSGMIAEETATSVTLRRADNASDTVLRIDIDELRSSGLSLMPEGLEKQVNKQAMADLIAYLLSVE